MAYTPYGWQNPYYAPPMPDNLMQMRQQQMQPVRECGHSSRSQIRSVKKGRSR